MNIVTEDMLTYSWNITSVDVINWNTYTNIVRKVYYTFTGVYMDHEYIITKKAILNLQGLETAEPLEFSDLTQEIVVGWLQEHLLEEVKNSYKSECAVKITEMVHPTYTNKTLPA